MPKATINDVAGLAGVSIKTVSRVVNREPNVRRVTRDKVLNAVRALNYRPNASARSLAGDKSYLIGLLYDNPSANYVTDVQYGVLAACREQSYDLLIHPCSYKDPAEELVALVLQSKMDGVLLTPPLSDTEAVVNSLEQARLPFVSIAPLQPDKDSVCVATNDHQAAFEMTEHLISLGHTAIGFVSGHPDHRAMMRRLEGYREALLAFNLQPLKHLIAQGYNSFESGEACARQLLLRKNPPSAIFASNDDMAAGVMMVAHQMGIAIPAGLSVAGFDDTPMARQIWPPLTTVQQPIKAMAETAAQILISRLRGQTVADPGPVIPSRLVIRQSTAVVK